MPPGMANTVKSRAIAGSVEQGLLRNPLALDEIYYRTTLRT